MGKGWNEEKEAGRERWRSRRMIKRKKGMRRMKAGKKKKRRIEKGKDKQAGRREQSRKLTLNEGTRKAMRKGRTQE